MLRLLFYTPILRAGWVYICCTTLTWYFKWWMVYLMAVAIICGYTGKKLFEVLQVRNDIEALTNADIAYIIRSTSFVCSYVVCLLECFSLAYWYIFPLPILICGITGAFLLEKIRPHLPKVAGNYNITIMVIIQLNMLRANLWPYALGILAMTECISQYGARGITKNFIRIAACAQICQTVFDTLQQR